jgi:hypothetical protein
MTTANVMEFTQLAKLIRIIGKRSSQVHTLIQQAAVGSIGHSIMYGDIRPGNELLAALHNSQRKDSLVKYMEQFGCFRYDSKTKKFDHQKRDKLTWDTDYAATVARFDWAKAKKAPEPSSIYDVAVALSALISQAQRAIEAGKKEIKHASLLDELADVFNRYESAEFTKAQAIRDALRANATESTVTTGTEEPATV